MTIPVLDGRVFVLIHFLSVQVIKKKSGQTSPQFIGPATETESQHDDSEW